MAAVWAVVWAVFAWTLNERPIDALIDSSPIFVPILGVGVLTLAFLHAGIDPQRAFDRLMAVAAIGAVGFVAGEMWTTFSQSEWNSQYQRDARRDFHAAIMSAPAPCVTSHDNLSDLSACTVFGLRPGMTRGEALRIVDGSGYFRNKEKPVTCKTNEKCSHSVSFLKDGLYLRVEFQTDPKSAAPEERVSEIVLSLDEGDNPYFDENQMLAAFLNLIDHNGSSINTTQTVWIDIKNAFQLTAYTYERKFWAIFSLRLADHSNSSGVPV